MTDHKKLWSDFSNIYTTKLLNLGLNYIPVHPKQFAEMTENEFNMWLSSINFDDYGKSPTSYVIQEKPLSSIFNIRSSANKTETLILPLSLEDNSTLPGTASILEAFGKEFSIPCDHKDEMLEFDEESCSFDLKGARTHYEFKEIISLHKDEMAAFERQICDSSKQLEEDGDDDNDDVDDCTDDTRDSADARVDTDKEGSSAMYITKKHLQKQDADFKKAYDKLTKMIWDAVHSQDSATKVDILISRLSKNRWWERKIDRFKRTVIHHAIECNNVVMVRMVLAAGINPNVKEGCGVTPLHLAVLAKNTELCKLLVDSFACINGLSFSSIPSPYEMAKSMNLNDVVLMFDEILKEQELLEQQLLALSSKAACHTDSECEHDQDENAKENDDTQFNYDRAQFCGFPTAVVGDQGTCKNNRSVKQRDQSAFSWVAEIPGDLHAKGHLCEAIFKAQGKGGFHHLVTKVLKRQKLTESAFRDKKFQEQNLAHIKEAVRDVSIAYGMAAVMLFKRSCYFPSKESLQKCLQKNGNHNEVLLHCFNNFLSERSAEDENFKYHSEMFTLFGPLLQLYNDATRFGQGLARETVWILLLPIFAQLQFRNYWTEAIVHVVNFTAVWPLAFREMIKNNSTVNVSGQDGKDIDLDEFVETYIVRPLKLYASGKLSMHTCRHCRV